MKKGLLFALALLALSTKAQITYDCALPFNVGQAHQFMPFTTSSLGNKYLITTATDTMLVYNDDCSLYRNIILPAGYRYSSTISDKLFNSDSLLEFLASYSISSNENILSVINELGQIQYTFPDTIANLGAGDIFVDNGVFKCSIVKINIIDSANSIWTYKVFSLPGTLPCNQCNYPTGLSAPTGGPGLEGLNVYPNPFNNNLEIEYNFVTSQDYPRIIIYDITGRELKVIPLLKQSDKITISTADLPKGIIILSLYGNEPNPTSKKMLKIN